MTSVTVAIQSQTIPWPTKIHISEFGSIAARAQCHHRTSFQRQPKRRAFPVSSRMRNKPMSMMRSNTTSVKSIKIKESLSVPTLSTTRQDFVSCDQLARNYGCQVSQAGPKQSNWKFTPTITWYHHISRFTIDSPRICQRYLLLTIVPMFAIHRAIEIAETILFLCQMAIL